MRDFVFPGSAAVSEMWLVTACPDAIAVTEMEFDAYSVNSAHI